MTSVSDRCVIGAACSVESMETIPSDTIICGAESTRHRRKVPLQVSLTSRGPPHTSQISLLLLYPSLWLLVPGPSSQFLHYILYVQPAFRNGYKIL